MLKKRVRVNPKSNLFFQDLNIIILYSGGNCCLDLQTKTYELCNTEKILTSQTSIEAEKNMIQNVAFCIQGIIVYKHMFALPRDSLPLARLLFKFS